MNSLVSQKNYRAIAAAIAIAFLGGIGAYLATRTTNSIENKLAGPPLVVRVLMPGDFRTGGGLQPYSVTPSTDSTSVKNALRELHFVNAGVPDVISKQDSLNEWSRARGGAWGSPQRLRIELRSRTKEPVTIQGFEVHVVRRKPALAGWYAATAECGPAQVRQARIYLDSNPPQVRFAANGFSPEQSQLTLTVTDTDIELLDLSAITRTGDVEWTAEVRYSGPEGPGRMKIDQDGRPFRVTSEVGSKGYSNYGSRLERRAEWDSGGIAIC